MTYCFKCPTCGYAVEQAVREPAPTHFHSWKSRTGFPQKGREVRMVRDYQAESTNVNVEGLH